jgi:ribosomal-protein-alanine N-acetyltransferase
MNFTPFNTASLLVEKLSTADAPEIYNLMNTPGWLRFIGDRNIDSIEKAQEYLQSRMIQSYDTHGFGLYKIARKEDGKFVGITGFVQRANLPKPDVGFAIMPEFEGMGFASESTLELLEYAKNESQINECWAMTNFENFRAQKLLINLNFQYDKEITSKYLEEGILYYKHDLNA